MPRIEREEMEEMDGSRLWSRGESEPRGESGDGGCDGREDGGAAATPFPLAEPCFEEEGRGEFRGGVEAGLGVAREDRKPSRSKLRGELKSRGEPRDRRGDGRASGGVARTPIRALCCEVEDGGRGDCRSIVCRGKVEEAGSGSVEDGIVVSWSKAACISSSMIASWRVLVIGEDCTAARLA
jgi:hypothetical protein